MDEPDVIGPRDSHGVLRQLLAAQAPGRILDVPAGHGSLSAFLVERGWDVHAADIDPGHFKLLDVPFTTVNLNETLPFDDESFDIVCCVNGLHRLLFPERAVQEFFRIIKPEGWLYINLNNYSSIRKRLRFLIKGTIDVALDTQECDQTTDNREAHVRLTIFYPRVHRMLKSAGFADPIVHAAAVHSRDRLLRPVALAVKGISRFFPGDSTGRRIIREANDWSVVGGGTYICVQCRKPKK
jgi:SAM-dependent methyltransferase